MGGAEQAVIEVGGVQLGVVAGPLDVVPVPIAGAIQGAGIGLGGLVIHDRGVHRFVDHGGPAEAGVVEGILRRHEEVGPEGLLVLELDDRGAPVIHARLVIAFRLGHGVVAAEFFLGSGGDHHFQAVVGQELGVNLEVVVVQQGFVGRVVHAHVVQVLHAVGAPPPDLVFKDRTAGVEAIVLDLDDPVVVRDARGQRQRRIVAGLEELVGQVEAAGQVGLVAAAPADHVQGDTAGLHGHIRAAGGDVQLFEHVEVVVQGRTAQGRRVADVDAVQGPDVVGAHVPVVADVALVQERGLLPGFVAADVLAVEHDARGELHDDPGVTSGRQGLQFLVVEVGLDDRLLGVDDGGHGHDRD